MSQNCNQLAEIGTRFDSDTDSDPDPDNSSLPCHYNAILLGVSFFLQAFYFE